MNVYGSLLSTPGIIEFNVEYNLLSFELLGLQSITYARAGTSMFGVQGATVLYSTPVIGFMQYIGNSEGVDFGASYLKHYHTGTDRNKKVPYIYKDIDELIRLEIGYRNYFSDNSIFRFTLTTFVDFEKLKNNRTSEFDYIISFSVGYSF